MARSHAEISRAGYQAGREASERELRLLRGELAVLRQTLAALKLENIGLRHELRRLGKEPSTVPSTWGDSR